MALDFVVLIPTKNEEITIREFINWVNIGIEKSQLSGQLVLIDSSTDNTELIAKSMNVRVVKVPRAGLGYAYKFAQNKFESKYVILGDADCTYDFRNLSPFLESLIQGNEFVMGNRFKGSIEPKSMPFHHRYIGTPITSWLLRKLTKLNYGDIHCGMRAMTTELYNRLPFLELGWEYAPEMVITATQKCERTSEVPINFLRSNPNRLSHFKRVRLPILESIKAGLGAVRVSFLYSARTIFKSLSKLLMGFGGSVFTLTYLQQNPIFGVTLSQTSRLLSFTLFIIGVVFYFMSMVFDFISNSMTRSSRIIDKIHFNSILLFNLLSVLLLFLILSFVAILILIENNLYITILLYLKTFYYMFIFSSVIGIGLLILKILKFQIGQKILED